MTPSPFDSSWLAGLKVESRGVHQVHTLANCRTRTCCCPCNNYRAFSLCLELFLSLLATICLGDSYIVDELYCWRKLKQTNRHCFATQQLLCDLLNTLKLGTASRLFLFREFYYFAAQGRCVVLSLLRSETLICSSSLFCCWPSLWQLVPTLQPTIMLLCDSVLLITLWKSLLLLYK